MYELITILCEIMAIFFEISKAILILVVFYCVLHLIITNAFLSFKKITRFIKKIVTLLLIITTILFFLTGPQIILLPIIFVIYILKTNTQIVAPEDSEMVIKPITSDSQELVNNLMSIPCKKGIKQFDMFDRKIQSFKVVISAQLDANELTFIIYTDAVEQMYFEVLKNLQHFYLVMTSIETINERQLAARLRTKYVKNESEKEALQQRLDLWRSQMKIAEELLVQNEQMLTKLDLITSKIANIELKNIRPRSSVETVAVTKRLDVNS